MPESLQGVAIPQLSHAPSHYKKIRTISLGAATAIVLVQRVSDGQQLVLKRVEVGGLANADRAAALSEVRILAQLRHPHIITYHESYIHDGYLNIIMEYARGGDLQQHLQALAAKGGPPLSEQRVLLIFCQVKPNLSY